MARGLGLGMHGRLKDSTGVVSDVGLLFVSRCERSSRSVVTVGAEIGHRKRGSSGAVASAGCCV